MTDLPTGIMEIFRGRQNLKKYLGSLASSDMDAVFSREDVLPWLAEAALLPYLYVKRGF